MSHLSLVFPVNYVNNVFNSDTFKALYFEL